ncbi:MAG: aspartyl/asparaginyl beta-hydroxylase domain-containing protein [Terricaulis sp.]
MARMKEDSSTLAFAAGIAAKEGRWQDAERLWSDVLARDPQNAEALLSLGIHALQGGEARRARDLLTEALAAQPSNSLALIALSASHRALGDADAALSALQSALILNPYHLPALLAKASLLESYSLDAARAVYANALKIAPPRERWPPELSAQLDHASRLVEAHRVSLKKHLLNECGPQLDVLPSDRRELWRESLSLLAGQSQPYHSICNQFCIPRLPAIPFYRREDFGWLADLERRTEQIRSELIRILEEDIQQFAPYIAYQPGDPVNQWRDLNHSDRWNAYHLWRGGRPVLDHLARCPITARALSETPLATISGLCPNAMFSVLAPHTHIPPHHGETNARLVAHLPLIIPQKCSLRVGFERREWRVGEIVVFDDTIEHEASNDSDELRAVLIFDVWNPYLTEAERPFVNDLIEARRAFVA